MLYNKLVANRSTSNFIIVHFKTVEQTEKIIVKKKEKQSSSRGRNSPASKVRLVLWCSCTKGHNGSSFKLLQGGSVFTVACRGDMQTAKHCLRASTAMRHIDRRNLLHSGKSIFSTINARDLFLL